jgi:aminopeptidase N
MALNFVSASNTTSGGEYLYTLCEPLYCRSFIPMMDTIAVKFTYDAIITTNAPWKAYMSADLTKEITNDDNKTSTFFF